MSVFFVSRVVVDKAMYSIMYEKLLVDFGCLIMVVVVVMVAKAMMYHKKRSGGSLVCVCVSLPVMIGTTMDRAVICLTTVRMVAVSFAMMCR